MSVYTTHTNKSELTKEVTTYECITSKYCVTV